MTWCALIACIDQLRHRDVCGNGFSMIAGGEFLICFLLTVSNAF